MRIALVGPADTRERLRAELDEGSFTVAGEFATLADARASGIEVDATLIAAPVGRAFTARLSKVDEVRGGDEYEEPLTRREVQVLELLAEGLPNKSIAVRLGISD